MHIFFVRPLLVFHTFLLKNSILYFLSLSYVWNFRLLLHFLILFLYIFKVYFCMLQFILVSFNVSLLFFCFFTLIPVFNKLFQFVCKRSLKMLKLSEKSNNISPIKNFITHEKPKNMGERSANVTFLQINSCKKFWNPQISYSQSFIPLKLFTYQNTLN